ncbi:hypothetical protein K7X08_021423 [Anisodus acutangulus]|uniref:TF-B3 domain-containing protein n=1 Tax=Anisodus acutangulus TaxID=402998 RepID=A0A9Q1LZD7_9SOLA|nr:hypothetical protein K7X08_021423 [Anisodus acutangulus]
MSEEDHSNEDDNYSQSDDKFEKTEIVVHKKLVKSEVNALGKKGLRVLNDAYDSTSGARGGGDHLNPPLVAPATLLVNDESRNQHRQWTMSLVEINEGMYLKKGWYFFAYDHGLKVGDTVTIERTLVMQNSEVLDTIYDITFKRAEESSSGSN